MIKRTKEGFKVTNESGTKNLSKKNLSKQEALKRLRQIEFWKNHKK